MKKIVCLVLFCVISTVAFAQNNVFSTGVHLGGQYNVGRLNHYNEEIQCNPQSNFVCGIMCKFNYKCFFVRPGFDFSVPIKSAQVLNDTATLKKTSINYFAVPAYLGCNFFVKSFSTVYMGVGISYMMLGGNVEMNNTEVISIEDHAFGYGFLFGISFSIINNLECYMEWQYQNYYSSPLIKTTNFDWQNYSVDLNGHRIAIGFMYHII